MPDARDTACRRHLLLHSQALARISLDDIPRDCERRLAGDLFARTLLQAMANDGYN
jgi:hypothetical protein